MKIGPFTIGGTRPAPPPPPPTKTICTTFPAESVFLSSKRTDIDDDASLVPGSSTAQGRLTSKLSETLNLRSGVTLAEDVTQRTITISLGTAGVPPVVLKNVSMLIARDQSSLTLRTPNMVQVVQSNGESTIRFPSGTLLSNHDAAIHLDVKGLPTATFRNQPVDVEHLPSGAIHAQWGLVASYAYDCKHVPLLTHQQIVGDNPQRLLTYQPQMPLADPGVRSETAATVNA